MQLIEKIFLYIILVSLCFFVSYFGSNYMDSPPLLSSNGVFLTVLGFWVAFLTFICLFSPVLIGLILFLVAPNSNISWFKSISWFKKYKDKIDFNTPEMD